MLFKIWYIENVVIESIIIYDWLKIVLSLIYLWYFICKYNVEEEWRRMSFCVIVFLLELFKWNVKILCVFGRYLCKCCVEG